MDIEIFVHPTCSTCHALLRRLHRWGLLDRVRIIDTSKDPYITIERGVRSVPSIFINGELAFAGVMDFEEVRNALLGNALTRSSSPSENELVQAFMRGVLDSVATALWLYVNEDCGAFLRDKATLKAMMGIGDKEFDEFEAIIRSMNCAQLISSNEESFLRVISTNFAREIYWVLGRMSWATIKDLYSREAVAHWMIVRSALGRVGLRPHRLSEPGFASKVDRVYGYLEQRFDELMDKVSKEQDEIAKDWPILAR